MKWVTRERPKADRIACPWLIKKFVDKDAEFIFVPTDKVMDEAKRFNAIPYDVKNVELGHHGKECSFEAILRKYDLMKNPALALLGKIVNGADTDNTLWNQPEAAGLNAIAEIGAAVPGARVAAFAANAGDPDQAQASVTDFDDAVRSDPENALAKYDLELALRALLSQGIQVGAGQQTGAGSNGQRGAGGGIPGNGY